MAAYLQFISRIRRRRTKSFKFIDKSGIHWILTQHCSDGGDLKEKISIRQLKEGIYRFYYADLELYFLNGTLVSEETVRGVFNTIVIDFNPDMILRNLKKSQLIGKEEVNTKLLFKVELHPLLKLDDSEQKIKKNGIESTVSGSTSLIQDPTLELYYDILLVSGDVKVKAHKSMLYARMPQFYGVISRLQQQKIFQDDLEVIELGGSAAAGLSEMVNFLYTAAYSGKLLSSGNLSLTAKEMHSEFYQRMFLEDCMKKLSPITVIYLIFLTQLNGIPEYLKKSLEFFFGNIESVKRTVVWVRHETFFNDLHQENTAFDRCRIIDPETMQLSYVNILKQYYESLNF